MLPAHTPVVRPIALGTLTTPVEYTLNNVLVEIDLPIITESHAICEYTTTWSLFEVNDPGTDLL